MWILRWTFIALVIIAIVGFSFQNNELVSVNVLSWNKSDVPVFLVVYFSFAAGMLVFLVVALFNQFQHKVEIRRLRRETKLLQQELDRLRTASLNDSPGDADTLESAKQ